jgi:hypothetical protein
VRTNRALYSQDFSNAAWPKGNVTLTASQADPNGGTSAFLVTDDATNDLHYFYQFVTPEAGEFTFSFYAKANTLTHCGIRLYDGSIYDSAIFNLSNGTKGSGDGSIESVGNGWYRVSLTKTLSASFAYFNVFLSNGSTFSYSGSGQSIYVFGAQYEAGVATDYIGPTTSAAVSVGPVANVPRLDYLGSSCPRLILEGQRTNSQTFSEQHNNAVWTKFNLTVSQNAGTSPDGYTNADLVYPDTGVVNVQNYNSQTRGGLTSGASYTQSVFLKASGFTWAIVDNVSGSAGANFTSFNVANGTIGTTGAGATAKIENYGNGWYRCSLTATTAATGSPNIFMWTARANDTIEYTGNGTNGTFLYGCQLEAGAYATSYIPTLGSASTRGSDAASKTSATALIGQTEGTLFAEIDLNLAGSNVGYYALQVYDSAASPTFSKGAYIELYQGKVYGYVRNTTVQCEIISSTYADNTRLKIAIAYKANDFALYVNGVQIGTDTSGSLPSVLNSLSLHYSAGTQQASPLSQALLFKTRLSNADLAALTA